MLLLKLTERTTELSMFLALLRAMLLPHSQNSSQKGMCPKMPLLRFLCLMARATNAPIILTVGIWMFIRLIVAVLTLSDSALANKKKTPEGVLVMQPI